MTYSELQEKGQRLTQKELNVIEKRIAKDLKVARDNINTKLQKLYATRLSDIKPEDRYNYMIQRDRLESLIVYSQGQYKQANIELSQKQASKLALSNSYYYQQFANDSVAPTVFAVLPDGVVKSSVYGEFVKNYEEFIPKYGGTLTEILSKNRTQSLEKIRQTIVSMFLQGQGYREAARNLTDTFNQSYNNALRVVRTEGHRNMEAGQYEASNQAKEDGADIIRKLVAVKDTRTRSQSASMDGQAEDKDGLFHYPNGATASYPGNTGVSAYDINDRETVINTIGGKDPEIMRVRNPKTGKTELRDYALFDDWAKENGLIRNKYGEIYKTQGV